MVILLTLQCHSAAAGAVTSPYAGSEGPQQGGSSLQKEKDSPHAVGAKETEPWGGLLVNHKKLQPPALRKAEASRRQHAREPEGTSPGGGMPEGPKGARRHSTRRWDARRPRKRMHTHTHARMHARTHSCTHTCTHTCTHVHSPTHPHAYTHTYAHIHRYTHTHTQTQTHRHTHKYTHLPTHTSTRA